MCSFCVSKTKSQNLSFFSFIFSFFISLVTVLVSVTVRHSSVSFAFSGMLRYAVALLGVSAGGQSVLESDFHRLLFALSLCF